MQPATQPRPNLLTVPLPEDRKSSINRIRQSFKLSLTPNKASDIRNYVLSPRYGANQQQFQSPQSCHSGDSSGQSPQSFGERYQVLQKLGEGAHGVVKKCQAKQSKNIYAVKTLGLDEQQTIFLRRNFYAVKCLRHPNILEYKSLHLDKKKDKCHLVMEYVLGKQLSPGMIHDQNTLKNIFQQIFSAIAYMHNKNICHRDIKPDNIMYDKQSGKIKIVDFGISKRIVIKNQKRSMLTVTGTFNYRAPEYFEGGGYDEGVDVWAAGISLYEMVTGKTPFESDFKMDTINNINNGQFRFDDEVWKGYSKFLRDLISRLLRKRSERLTAAEALHHLWFTNDPEKENAQKFMSVKASNKTRAFDVESFVQSVVKKKLANEFIRVVQKPQLNFVESDEEGDIYEDT